MTQERLEQVARLLCEARGIEPDALQSYDNGTMALTRRPAWRNAAAELLRAKQLADHVRMLDEDAQ